MRKPFRLLAAVLVCCMVAGMLPRLVLRLAQGNIPLMKPNERTCWASLKVLRQMVISLT